MCVIILFYASFYGAKFSTRLHKSHVSKAAAVSSGCTYSVYFAVNFLCKLLSYNVFDALFLSISGHGDESNLCLRFFTEFGKRSFSYLASTVWNDLPLVIKLSPITDNFSAISRQSSLHSLPVLST